MDSVAASIVSALDRVEFARSLSLDPDWWQADLLRSEANRVLLNCCRQSGKSTVSAIMGLHRALYFPGSLVLCLAPALRQSQELFQKISEFYRAAGKPVVAVSDRKLGLELANGSRIECLPGDERTTRGFSGVSLLLVDEAARVDDGLYYAVRPMLAVSGGRLIMLSTPWGKRGVFYEAWTEGQEWERYKAPASECPRISPAFLAEERANLPEWVYRQEYECSFEETQDQLFTAAMVEAALDDEVQPIAQLEGLTW